jgi:hypothetical protein
MLDKYSSLLLSCLIINASRLSLLNTRWLAKTGHNDVDLPRFRVEISS